MHVSPGGTDLLGPVLKRISEVLKFTEGEHEGGGISAVDESRFPLAAR